jgi:phosphoribosylpyrophosphate synthetase
LFESENKIQCKIQSYSNKALLLKIEEEYEGYKVFILDKAKDNVISMIVETISRNTKSNEEKS